MTNNSMRFKVRSEYIGVRFIEATPIYREGDKL